MHKMSYFLLAAFVFLTLADDVTGFHSYEVEVTVHSYLNPNGRCDGCRIANNSNPGCCDEDIVRPLNQACPVDTCDFTVTVVYCIRPLDCPSIVAPRFAPNSSNFSFGSTFLGIPNPLLIRRSETWAGARLVLVFKDCDDIGLLCNILIDNITIDINVTVGTSSPEATYNGSAGIAQVNVSFEVRCADGHYGSNCSTECIDFQSCADCQLPGYTGDFCQFNIDDCIGINCNNSGECVDELNGFMCQCNPGYTGDFCQYNINDCEVITCNDNGNCVDELNGFMCQCNPGYTGDFCQYNINDCEGITCNDNGNCVDELNGFMCQCNPGYTGDFCNDCEGITCNDNGNCVDELNGFVCLCNPGYTGEECENVDHCFNMTCSGNGQCLNLLDGFVCACEQGFTGVQCEVLSTQSGASASVGGIAGGVVGGLIGLILIAIVMVIVVIVQRNRRSKQIVLGEDDVELEDNHLYMQVAVHTEDDVELEDNPSYMPVAMNRPHITRKAPPAVFPGDNPSYDALHSPTSTLSNNSTNPSNHVDIDNAHGRTRLTSSMQEREFHNPIYSKDEDDPSSKVTGNGQDNPISITQPRRYPDSRAIVDTGGAGGRTRLDSSMQERDFDNPIYSGHVADEDPYTVPDSPPSNTYDRVAGDHHVGEHVHMDNASDTALYYSTIRT